MDNLTHSLAGAVLGQMGLKRKTGLAMPTLIIAANIPDIDAVATLMGGVQHLGIRRGITHGPIALLLLPILLWAIMLCYDRWRPKTDRPAVHKGWLLALAFIGTASHPALDWLNNYGIRLLEPFSGRWAYGDTIFIIDVWIWAALIGSVWLSRRREKRGQGEWQRPAWIGFAAICAYIFANGLITGRAEALTGQHVESELQVTPDLVVANPVPLQFWKREMQWRNAQIYGQGEFSLPGHIRLIGPPRKHGMDDPRVAETARHSADGRAFLVWSRMPVAVQVGEGFKARTMLFDQRFAHPMARDRFMIELPDPPLHSQYSGKP